MEAMYGITRTRGDYWAVETRGGSRFGGHQFSAEDEAERYRQELLSRSESNGLSADDVKVVFIAWYRYFDSDGWEIKSEKYRVIV